MTRLAQAWYLLSDCMKARYLFKILDDEGVFRALTAGRPRPHPPIYHLLPTDDVSLVCHQRSFSLQSGRNHGAQSMSQQGLGRLGLPTRAGPQRGQHLPDQLTYRRGRSIIWSNTSLIPGPALNFGVFLFKFAGIYRGCCLTA